MNATVFLSTISGLFFLGAVCIIILRYKRIKLDLSVSFPLVLSLLLYAFIVVSNFLEHSGITTYFDPTEDIAEILFTLIFLFFVNNWRKQRTLEYIQRQEAWLRTAFESIGDGIMTTDGSGHIRQMNSVMEEFTGWPIDEASGRKAGDILSFTDQNNKAVRYNPFDIVLKGGNEKGARVWILLHSRSGRSTIITDTTSAIYSKDGKLVGMVGVFRDMGEYQSLLEQVSHLHKMEALGQLVGGVAHDLNNMLGGIMGAADLLNIKFSKEEKAKYGNIVEMLMKSAKSASGLTSNLLAFSRRGKLRSIPVVVQDIIKSTIAIAERTVNKMIEIENNAPPEPLVVEGDPSQIQSALLNLVVNARDAMPAGGKIKISAGVEHLDNVFCAEIIFKIKPGEYVFLSVEDSGIGIPEENIKRIFEPYYTTKEDGKGTGLGLAAVLGTAFNHHGAVTVKSEPGKGSIFSLHLPSSHAIVKDSAEINDELKAHGRGNILIIDDESTIRYSAKMMLEELGYGTYTASSGEEGLEIYREKMKEINLVFLDVIMPGMDGREVFKRLREVNPAIKVIMTSGYTENENIPGGIAGFIDKPFGLNKLVEVVEKVMG